GRGRPGAGTHQDRQPADDHALRAARDEPVPGPARAGPPVPRIEVHDPSITTEQVEGPVLARQVGDDLDALAADRCDERAILDDQPAGRRDRLLATLAVADAAEDHVAAARHRAERSEEHTSELQSRENLVCRLLL